MPYKHGAYGEIIPSQEKINSSLGTIPFYVGTAPVHRTNSANINKSLLIRNLDEAQIKLGYTNSDNFEDFSLSAVVFAHFENSIQPIGPIIVVNVLDQSKHVKKDIKKSITLINKVAYIDDYVILDSLKVSDNILGKDYKVEYEEGRVKLTVLKDIVNPVDITYDKADPSAVTEADVIGAYNAEKDTRTGIQCIETVYQDLNVIPNILSAPGWNHKPNVERALVQVCKKIDNHYDTIIVTDIDCSVAKTLNSALEWKVANGYNFLNEKTCWPKTKKGDKSLWMSINAIVRMQQTDSKNKGIPYESPSNKPIDINGLIVVDNGNITFNSVQANKLNEKGITTALFNGGKWVLWGPHMANYDYLTTNKPDEVFDVNVRMSIYLNNDFQLRNAELVDAPIARNDLDGILNTEQMRLDSLVSDGKLLYGKIEFIPISNPASDLIQGDFNFDTAVTTTPPGKSLTNRIQYTSKGIDTLLEGGE